MVRTENLSAKNQTQTTENISTHKNNREATQRSDNTIKVEHTLCVVDTYTMPSLCRALCPIPLALTFVWQMIEPVNTSLSSTAMKVSEHAQSEREATQRSDNTIKVEHTLCVVDTYTMPSLCRALCPIPLALTFVWQMIEPVNTSLSSTAMKVSEHAQSEREATQRSDNTIKVEHTLCVVDTYTMPSLCRALCPIPLALTFVWQMIEPVNTSLSSTAMKVSEHAQSEREATQRSDNTINVEHTLCVVDTYTLPSLFCALCPIALTFVWQMIEPVNTFLS
ncbi:hypothetical protein J6590_018830 [Homalodisca vitripennis]|nr:hypothetical protein J6590_018830 [Homalodisca vitripennis]